MDYWGGGGGGGQRVCWPPSQIIGGGPGPPCPPSSYAYGLTAALACLANIHILHPVLIQTFAAHLDKSLTLLMHGDLSNCI